MTPKNSDKPCKWCGRVRDLHYDFGQMWCEETREGHRWEPVAEPQSSAIPRRMCLDKMTQEKEP